MIFRVFTYHDAGTILSFFEHTLLIQMADKCTLILDFFRFKLLCSHEILRILSIPSSATSKTYPVDCRRGVLRMHVVQIASTFFSDQKNRDSILKESKSQVAESVLSSSCRWCIGCCVAAIWKSWLFITGSKLDIPVGTNG